jgi:MFS family permease
MDGSPKDSSLNSSHNRKSSVVNGDKIHLIEAVKTRSYLLLIAVFFFCGLTDIPIFTHFIPFALDLGLSEMVAASAFGLTSGFMLLGTFFVGGISGRFGEKNSLQAVYLIRGTSLILALFVNDFMSLSAFSVIFGFSTFAMMPVTSTWLADNYGTVYFATLWGILQVVHEISAAIGVYLFGFIFEMFGSYYWGFAGSIFLAFSAAIFSFFIRTPTSK